MGPHDNSNYAWQSGAHGPIGVGCPRNSITLKIGNSEGISSDGTKREPFLLESKRGLNRGQGREFIFNEIDVMGFALLFSFPLNWECTPKIEDWSSGN